MTRSRGMRRTERSLLPPRYPPRRIEHALRSQPASGLQPSRAPVAGGVGDAPRRHVGIPNAGAMTRAAWNADSGAGDLLPRQWLAPWMTPEAAQALNSTPAALALAPAMDRESDSGRTGAGRRPDRGEPGPPGYRHRAADLALCESAPDHRDVPPPSWRPRPPANRASGRVTGTTFTLLHDTTATQRSPLVRDGTRWTTPERGHTCSEGRS